MENHHKSNDIRSFIFPKDLDTGDVILFSRNCGAMPPFFAVVCFGAKV